MIHLLQNSVTETIECTAIQTRTDHNWMIHKMIKNLGVPNNKVYTHTQNIAEFEQMMWL